MFPLKSSYSVRISDSENLDLFPVGVFDGGIILVNEVVLNQLDGEGGLADASSPHDNKLVLCHH